MAEVYQLKQPAAQRPHVLQLCHGYGAPFLDVARQYVSLFRGAEVAVTTVYLTGVADTSVAQATGGEEVIFLQFSSRQIRGLKLAAIRQVAAICRRRSVTFAIAHRYKAIYIASHVDGVFVVGVHHAFGDYRRRSRRWYVNRRRDRIALLGVSNAVRDDIRSRLPQWPRERIETLYNRVDYAALQSQLISRQEARRQLGIDDHDFVFANVGRLHPDKDQQTLLNAFALVAQELPDARLLIIGEGRLQQALQQQIDDLGLQARVRLTGRVPDAAHLFSAFDGFLLSSDFEPFGMVLLEAMAAGLPIAASDCGGASEVVGDSGLLFPMGDATALAVAMREIYRASPARVDEWRAAMDARVKSLFTLEAGAAVFRQYSFVIQHLPVVATHGSE